MIYIGIDDTDMPGTRGTGHLARQIAAHLAQDFTVIGVVRHQLWFDSQVPYTAKNSSASIILADTSALEIQALGERVSDLMRKEYIEGSDPGLAIARQELAQQMIAWGQRAKQELLSREEATALVAKHDIYLKGLGGTCDGIIGALAAIGLSSSGNDGRYIQFKAIRDITLPCAVQDVLEAGIQSICTLSGDDITHGTIHGKNLRPSRRESNAVLYVEPLADEQWQALKID